MTARPDSPPERGQTCEQLLATGVSTGATAPCDRRDAELLLAHVLAISRTKILLDPMRMVSAVDAGHFLQLLARRANGEPLAYLTGLREFWSLTLAVTADVLVPRPETELVVERALALCRLSRARALDLGTGSGAIALALATDRPDWRITAIDRSAWALEVARHNAVRLGLQRVDWRLGSWFDSVADEHFDLIVSNPPYVRDADPALTSDGVRHEPMIALRAGHDGLAALRDICAQAPPHLSAGGVIVLEHGCDQDEPVRKLLVDSGFIHVRSHPDLAGLPRVTEAVWPG